VLSDEFMGALGSIRVCEKAGEASGGVCGEEPSGGSVRRMFAVDTEEEWLESRPPLLRRQHKIRRLSPKDLSVTFP